ncbi:MAG: hypothetical protein ABI120_17650 [Gemmatimonadaceae bacterium]
MLKYVLQASLLIVGACQTHPTEPILARYQSQNRLTAPWKLSVIAAPSDDGMYLSWIPLPGNNTYSLRWRVVTDSGWKAQPMEAKNHAFIPNLAADVRHEFIVSVTRNGATLSADTVSTVTRARGSCAYGDYVEFQSFFCSQASADGWLQSRGIAHPDLRCRNQVVTNWGPGAPDCLYTAGNNFHMLLLRNADSVYTSFARPPSIADTRAMLRQAIWPNGDPFGAPERLQPTALPQALTGNVKKYVSAVTFLFDAGGFEKSRVTRFIPATPVPGQYAIVHEGHGGGATDIGSDMIDFMLDRGWEVYAMDMLVSGANGVDATLEDLSHWALPRHDDGVTSTLAMHLLPVKRVIDFVAASRPRATAIVMMGPSGGAWTSFMYGALDPRVTAVIAASGGRPMSQRLLAPWGPLELGDPEQSAPEVFSGIRYEDIMVAAGARGAQYLYTTNDPCCFRMPVGDPLIDYVERGGARSSRTIRLFVDGVSTIHGISAAGFIEIDRFLKDLFP